MKEGGGVGQERVSPARIPSRIKYQKVGWSKAFILTLSAMPQSHIFLQMNTHPKTPRSRFHRTLWFWKQKLLGNARHHVP